MPRKPISEGTSRWLVNEEDIENDVPASLLVETNERLVQASDESPHVTRDYSSTHREMLDGQAKAQWQTANPQHRIRRDSQQGSGGLSQPRSLTKSLVPGGHREKALWRWVNISNLDSFMRDVYDYYEGGGLLCILCANALWLLYV